LTICALGGKGVSYRDVVGDGVRHLRSRRRGRGLLGVVLFGCRDHWE
jgi:hypothetical protein